jgi:hypothetical protein
MRCFQHGDRLLSNEIWVPSRFQTDGWSWFSIPDAIHMIVDLLFCCPPWGSGVGGNSAHSVAKPWVITSSRVAGGTGVSVPQHRLELWEASGHTDLNPLGEFVDIQKNGFLVVGKDVIEQLSLRRGQRFSFLVQKTIVGHVKKFL